MGHLERLQVQHIYSSPQSFKIIPVRRLRQKTTLDAFAALDRQLLHESVQMEQEAEHDVFGHEAEGLTDSD